MTGKETADQRYVSVEDAIFGAFEILAAKKGAAEDHCL